MTRKDIEKASFKFGLENQVAPGLGGELRIGFVAGAEWRINSVWHDLDEVVIKPGFILIEFQNKHELCYNIWRVKSTDIAAAWGKFMKENKAIRYAYIKDLLPIKEDEE